MVLDIFTQKLGDDLMPRLDPDTKGIVAVQMLDAIQTVVNVLTDADTGKGWTVTFDPGMNAYTDRSETRHIVVSGKPLLDAQPGTRLDKVAAIMTGFAVHEVGHTKLDYFSAVNDRWPGAKLPKVLANVIEDVVLELRTVERFPGFADNGAGNVFRPTLEWVADLTCPKYPLEWAGSTGHKVNVVGQILRYRDFVTFSTDPATAEAVEWVERWAAGITADLTPSGCVELIADLLAYMKASIANEAEPEPQVEPPLPPTGGQSIPNEDDETEPTEGDDEPGEGEGEGDEPGDEPGEGNGEADDADDESDESDDTEGEGGEGDSDDADGDGQPGEGDDEGEGEGEDGEAGDGDGEARSGDGNDADTMHRTEAPKGANDGPGSGGSGQAVADASDPDDGFDEADLDKTFDDLANPEGENWRDRIGQSDLARAEADERVTTRMDAGAFGKMRVIFR